MILLLQNWGSEGDLKIEAEFPDGVAVRLV
jgi:hypothetical protein